MNIKYFYHPEMNVAYIPSFKNVSLVLLCIRRVYAYKLHLRLNKK